MSLYDYTFKWGLNYKFDSYWGKAPRPSKAPRPPKKVIAPRPAFLLAKAATVASLSPAVAAAGLGFSWRLLDARWWPYARAKRPAVRSMSSQRPQ